MTSVCGSALNGVMLRFLQVERERLLRKHSKVGAVAKELVLYWAAELVSTQLSSVALQHQQQVLQQLMVAYITIMLPVSP
jgi:hypothetical protein